MWHLSRRLYGGEDITPTTTKAGQRFCYCDQYCDDIIFLFRDLFSLTVTVNRAQHSYSTTRPVGNKDKVSLNQGESITEILILYLMK
jgi:hypothetical protein